MADLIDRLAAVWSQVPTGDRRDEAAFRGVYTDPVVLNGSDAAISELVERYRMLHRSFTDLGIEVLDRRELPGTLAVVLRQRGRHVGPLPTALGTVAPTGRTFDVLGIDVLTVHDERISRIWAVADELGRLAQLHAVTLAQPRATRDTPDLRCRISNVPVAGHVAEATGAVESSRRSGVLGHAFLVKPLLHGAVLRSRGADG